MGAKQGSERGQALIEFVVFLPFMLMMYTMVLGLGDAIHGSINQQKVARSYFYYRMQNSAHVSRPFRAPDPVFQNWDQFGNFFVGWADYLDNNRPYYPCYRINLPFAEPDADDCSQPYSDPTTQFIRVGTVYGACGATYARDSSDPNLFAEQPAGANGISVVLNMAGCGISAR